MKLPIRYIEFSNINSKSNVILKMKCAILPNYCFRLKCYLMSFHCLDMKLFIHICTHILYENKKSHDVSSLSKRARSNCQLMQSLHMLHVCKVIKVHAIAGLKTTIEDGGSGKSLNRQFYF